MKLGQPAHLKEKAKGGFTDKVRLEDGENIHRVIYGPVKVQYIYYPTLQRDAETNELKQSIRVIKRPQEGCILDSLASFEKRVRIQKGEKNPNSNLSPRSKWLYLVIDRNSEEPEIKVAEYPYKVFDQILKLEAAKSSKNTNKLRHGLIFMYDLIITKSVEKGKPRQYGTSYHVEVDPENAWSGKIPVAALGMPAEELEKRFKGFKQFFPKDDWKLIEDMDIDLEKEGEADSPEEILHKLKENPIYLQATSPDGGYMFPALEEFKEQMEEAGVDYTESGKKKPATKGLLEGSDKQFKDLDNNVSYEEEEEEGDEVEEADFEEIEEGEKPKKKKKKGRKPKVKPPPEPEPEEEEEEEEELEETEEEEELEEIEEEEEEEEEAPPKKKKSKSKSKKKKDDDFDEDEEDENLMDW